MSERCSECNTQVDLTIGQIVAERADIFRAAHALLKDLGYEDPTIDDAWTVARFLAGDDIGE